MDDIDLVLMVKSHLLPKKPRLPRAQGYTLATVSVPSDAESNFCSSATTLGWEKLRWIGAVKQPYDGCKHVCVYIYMYTRRIRMEIGWYRDDIMEQ